jgi:type VI secretion system secreted protein VgrG
MTLQLLADTQSGQDKNVDFDKLVGSAISIEIELQTGGKRFINGVMRSIAKEQQRERFAVYRAEMTPWLFFLGLRSNCRVFQRKTVPDIVSAIVEESGFKAAFRSDLSKTYTAWDLCVQYRETDLAFVSRLLESEGISYYFEHTDDRKHTWVLADTPGAFKPCPGQSSFLYDPEAGVGDFEDTINSWAPRQQLLSGKWMLRDHHFEMPGNTLEVPEDSVHANDVNRQLERYDFPGEYAKKFNEPEKRLGDVRTEGEKLARLYMEGDEANHLVVHGAGRCRAMVTGHTATINAKGAAGVEGTWLLTGIQHSALQHPDYLTQGRTGEGYSSTFSVIDSSVPYHPPQLTPKPFVRGPQTAVVVDENPDPSEEIWPDKYGRVRVRFRWDRQNNSACWLRVAQAWAGKAWGHQWIPRVGDEVIVAFLEGDPDCPLITGSLYNYDNMPPFKLPDNKTQSGILTRSSPNGGSEDYNMIRIEDKAGSEEIFVHAQKALKTTVEQDESRAVSGQRSTTITQDDTRTVEKGNDELKVKKGNRTVTISMGDRKVEVSQGNDSLNVSLGNITVQAPVGTHKTQAMQIELDGTVSIKLSCGASSIEMNPAMINITSPLVKIN